MEASTSGKLLCPTYKRAVRQIPQDCNHRIFSNSKYLKPHDLKCLLAVYN